MLEALKLVDALKLPAKMFFAVGLAAGVLLFLPAESIAILGLKKFVVDYRPYVGAIFVIAASLCIVTAVAGLGKFIWPWIAQGYEVHCGKTRLRNLNPQEKRILAHYIEHQTRAQTLDVANAAVKVLELEHIIFCASTLGRMAGLIPGFSYGLQPWAWEYLNKHPEVLK